MKVHALVVDDSRIMRKMIIRALNDTNLASFSFTEAGDGVEALDKFDPDCIDMLFVDWNMPKMNGIDFIRKVREIEKRHTPVVMITTENTIGKMDEAVEEVRVDKYVSKPFTVDGLKSRLEPVFTKMAGGGQSGGSKGFFSKLMSSIK